MHERHPDWVSHQKAMINRLQAEIDRLRAALSIAKTVCGQNNCNCPGASKVKEAVRDV